MNVGSQVQVSNNNSVRRAILHQCKVNWESFTEENLVKIVLKNRLFARPYPPPSHRDFELILKFARLS